MGYSHQHDGIIVRVWLPDGWANAQHLVQGFDEEDFISSNCRSCRYWFVDQVDDGVDGDGNSYVTTTTSCCDAYRDDDLSSYYNEQCPEGYDVGDPNGNADEDYKLAPTCFEFYFKPSVFLPDKFIALLPEDGERKPNIRSYLQCVTSSADDSEVRLSGVKRNLNCFADNDYVCWGTYSDFPTSIDQAISTFAATPSNDDLLSLDQYRDNASVINFSPSVPADPSFEYRSGADALLLLHPQLHRDAFRQLRTAGIGTVGESGMLAAYVKRATVFNNEGFITEADALLRQWFIHRNTLIGQIPND